MPSHLSNPWNNAAVFLEMCTSGSIIGSGSAFFWSTDNRTYLVTNWHNLSGRNHLTNEIMHSDAVTPDSLRVWLYRQTSGSDEAGYYDLDYAGVEVGLLDAEDDAPIWFEHPTLGQIIDIAAIDVTAVVEGYQVAHANEIEDDFVGDARASQEVFVIGFPFGRLTGAPAPVWKRGSIALDPTFDVGGLPKMLVDSATREGMSGSVVVARFTVAGTGYRKKDGSMSEPVIFGVKDTVIGVYSGRHYPDPEKAQLCIVWKRSAIEETIANRKRSAPR